MYKLIINLYKLLQFYPFLQQLNNFNKEMPLYFCIRVSLIIVDFKHLILLYVQVI